MSRKRKWNPDREPPASVEHGRYTTYNNYKCRCEPCRNAYREYCRDYRARNRDKLREVDRAYKVRMREDGRNVTHHRWQRYRLTPEAFAEMLESQGNVCAICLRNFGARGPHVDHDHACCPAGKSCGECVRGLLCWLCNSALGKFNDDPRILSSAIEYVITRSATRTHAE